MEQLEHFSNYVLLEQIQYDTRAVCGEDVQTLELLYLTTLMTVLMQTGLRQDVEEHRSFLREVRNLRKSANIFSSIHFLGHI